MCVVLINKLTLKVFSFCEHFPRVKTHLFYESFLRISEDFNKIFHSKEPSSFDHFSQKFDLKQFSKEF